MEDGLSWQKLLLLAKGLRPHLHVNSNLMEEKSTRRDFALACQTALVATTSCNVLPDRQFPPHFALLTEFSLAAWNARVERWPGFTHPSGPLVGFSGPIGAPLLWRYKSCGMCTFRSVVLCPQGVDKTPTHKTHLCGTVCSQARTAQLMRLAQELHCHLCV